jgi:hypothetical protein
LIFAFCVRQYRGTRLTKFGKFERFGQAEGTSDVQIAVISRALGKYPQHHGRSRAANR